MRRRFAFIKDYLDPTNHTLVGIPMMIFLYISPAERGSFFGGEGKDYGE